MRASISPGIAMNTHPELWAKQDGFEKTYPLIAHLLDTVTVAGALYDHWLRPGLRELIEENLGKQARSIVIAVMGLHDVGKANPLFQQRPQENGLEWQKIREIIDSSGNYTPIPPRHILLDRTKIDVRRHECSSAYTLQPSPPTEARAASKLWLHLVLGGHHGRFLPVLKRAESTKIQNGYKDYGWEQAQKDLTDLVLKACNITTKDIPEKVDPTIVLLLSGLVILADRIASGALFVDSGFDLLSHEPELLNDPSSWVTRRKAEAEKRVHNTVGIYSPWPNPQAAREAILGKYSPRPIQQRALDAGDGLWSLMATTGSGKTEAALLRHSTRPERLIFLLPTQATSNAIMRRVQHAYQGTCNVAALAHGLASVEDFYTKPISVYDDEAINGQTLNATDKPDGLYPSSFVRAGAARLFAPVCVGTIDQALAASLPGKWIHFRLLALANSHIVIDEVHTLDPYQSKLLEGILPWLAKTRTRVTFLTATMPSSQREQLLAAYSQGDEPLSPPIFPSIDEVTSTNITSTPVESLNVTMNIDLRQTTFDSLVSSHIAWHTNIRQQYPTARIGIICNTVRRAQDIARELQLRGEHVLLLHSRMTAEHRRQTATQLLDLVGPKGTGENITVIGTQAIEASLDIDLDFLNSEICPAPSLVQRAGRQWRHPDPHRSERCPNEKEKTLTITWFESDEDGQYLPYLAAELRRTYTWLSNHKQLIIPDHAQDFIDSAHVDFTNAETDSDHDALTQNLLKSMRGDSNRAEISAALEPHAEISKFSSLTTDNPADESTTRLIDQGSQARLIMGSVSGKIPGSWKGTPEELLALTSQDKEQIRHALRASMPLYLARSQGREDYLTEHDMISLAGSRSLLAGYYFMPQADRWYDELLGFTDHDESDKGL